MTIVIQEQPDSRSGQGSIGWRGKQTRHYWGLGSSDIYSVLSTLDSDPNCPATVSCPAHLIDLIRTDVRYRPLDNAQTKWDLYMDYEDPQVVDDKMKLDTGDYRFSVNTTGGTARITSSLETVTKYARPGETAPDHKQAIGVTREGDVQGVDIVVPACRFQIH